MQFFPMLNRVGGHGSVAEALLNLQVGPSWVQSWPHGTGGRNT